MTWPPRDDAPLDPQMQSFLAACGDNPDDADVRLIFADWLEDHGDPRAEVLRLQAEYLCLEEGDHDGNQVVLLRVQAWRKRYAGEWLGPGLLLARNGIDLQLEKGLLELKSSRASRLLNDIVLAGMRQLLREGWINYFRLTRWDSKLIEEAAEMGLFAGPRTLHWSFGEWGDAAFATLRGLAQIRVLIAPSSGSLTDTGLGALAGLTSLRKLELWGSECLTGDGLAHLMGLINLGELHLGGCQRLTDSGLLHLAGLTGLRKLNLDNCNQLTDAGMAHLADLTGLEDLSLSSCFKITGAGVRHLHGLHRLRRLDLVGCELKSHETRALREALPECEVIRR
jgi:uncharacterized protein (TIGR02996 family)